MKNSTFITGYLFGIKKGRVLTLFLVFALIFSSLYSQCVLADEPMDMEHHQQMTESDCEGFCDMEKESVEQEEATISQSGPMESQVVQKAFPVTEPRIVVFDEKLFEPWIYLNYLPPGSWFDGQKMRL